MKVIETDWVASPSQAQTLAFIALAESDGGEYVYPRHVFSRGQSNFLTGDIFPVDDSGDLKYKNMSFRAARTEHDYDRTGEAPTWETAVAMQTMSDTEYNQAVRNALIPLII